MAWHFWGPPASHISPTHCPANPKRHTHVYAMHYAHAPAPPPPHSFLVNFVLCITHPHLHTCTGTDAANATTTLPPGAFRVVSTAAPQGNNGGCVMGQG